MKHEDVDQLVRVFFSSSCDLSDEESDLLYRRQMRVKRFGEPTLNMLMKAWEDPDYSFSHMFLKHEVIADDDDCTEEEARQLAWDLMISPIHEVKKFW